MTLTKQRVELPLGVGVERKSQIYTGEAAKVRTSQNTIFFDTNSAKKRRGESLVGEATEAAASVLPQRALLGRKGQLATVGYQGLRYLLANQLTALPGQRGLTTQSIRTIPCLARSRKVRGDLPTLTSVPHAATANSKIVYAWASTSAASEVNVRVEDLDGGVVVPDRVIASASASSLEKPLTVVANGTQARVYYRDSNDDVANVLVDLSANTIGSSSVYFAGTTGAYDSLPDPADSGHVYLIFYDNATNVYLLRRILLSSGATVNTATITPTAAPVNTSDAGARLHIGSDGKVWAFIRDGLTGAEWKAAIYTQTLGVHLALTAALAFATYGTGVITDLAIAERGSPSNGATDPNLALILAQHERGSTENPGDSSPSVLDTYTLTNTGTLATGGSSPPLSSRIPNCMLAGRAFNLASGTRLIPFFPIRYRRDVDDVNKPTFAAGTLDFEFHTSMLVTTHYGDSSTIPAWNVAARYGVDLEGEGSRPMPISATKVAIAHAAVASAGGLSASSLYVTSFDFDPQNVPSEEIDGVWFGLAHQGIWSGAELLDGACPAVPGPPIVANASGAGATYRYKVVWEWEADDGALVRSHESPPSATFTEDMNGGGDVAVHIEMPPAIAANHWTNKRAFVALYRTAAGLVEPYRLVTRSNALLPSTASIAAKVGSWQYTDNNTDASIAGNATIYTTGNRLPAEPPPPFLDFTRVGDRLWALDGQDDHRVWPSLLFEEQTAPEWSSVLTLRLPSALVAVAELAGRPLLLGSDGIWTVYGTGPNNTGGGDTFQAAQVSSSYGAVSSATVARTPLGVVFEGRRGLYVVTPDMQCQPWGLEVDEVLRGLTVSRVVHVEPDHQIRVYTEEGTACVYDLVAGQWSTWTGMEAQEILDLDGTIYRLEAGAGSQSVWREEPDLPSDLPSSWTDVGSPPVGTGTWRGMVRGLQNRLYAVADDGNIGTRPLGSSWSLQQLFTPDLWLDATVSSSVDLDATPQWNDRRSNGRNLGWAAATLPVYPAAITRNGLAVIDCNNLTAAPGQGTSWNTILPVGNLYTCFAVLRIESVPAGRSLTVPSTTLDGMILMDSGGNSIGLRVFNNGGTDYIGGFHYTTGTTRICINKSITLGTWYVVRWYYDGTDMHLAVNNVDATAVPSAVRGNPGSISNAQQRGTTSSGTRWYQAEIRFWQNLLTAAQRTTQENFLKTKWGFSY